jgi:hypothetical protein
MNHQRHVIREAIVALLAAAGTTASTRVYDTPSDPRTAFPALVVEDDGEDQQVTSTMGGGMAGRMVERTLRVIVNAEVQQTTNYARTRDQLLAAVEAALAGSAIAGVKAITPAGYQADLNVQGERPIALGRQRFDVVYLTTQGNPATTF